MNYTFDNKTVSINGFDGNPDTKDSYLVVYNKLPVQPVAEPRQEEPPQQNPTPEAVQEVTPLVENPAIPTDNQNLCWLGYEVTTKMRDLLKKEQYNTDLLALQLLKWCRNQPLQVIMKMVDGYNSKLPRKPILKTSKKNTCILRVKVPTQDYDYVVGLKKNFDRFISQNLILGSLMDSYLNEKISIENCSIILEPTKQRGKRGVTVWGGFSSDKWSKLDAFVKAQCNNSYDELLALFNDWCQCKVNTNLAELVNLADEFKQNKKDVVGSPVSNRTMYVSRELWEKINVLGEEILDNLYEKKGWGKYPLAVVLFRSTIFQMIQELTT